MSDPTPNQEPGILTRTGDAVAGGLRWLADKADQLGEDAAQAVTEEMPAIEHAIVAYAQAHVGQFAADEVGALIVAVPQLAGFKDTLTEWANDLTAKFVGVLAEKFPDPKATKPASPNA